MIKRVVGLCFCFLMLSCSRENDFIYDEIKDSILVYCPDPPIEIMSSEDSNAIERGERLLNYFCILQESDNLFYMYYEMFKGEIKEAGQSLCFAYSTDCINWEKRFPNSLHDSNIIIPNNISGVSVMKVSDRNCPYRLFATRNVNGRRGIFMWKSPDGINFIDEKFILEGTYDTQHVGILRGSLIKLYTRLWEQEGHNRKIGVAYIDIEGNVLRDPIPLKDNYVYNSAASSINDNFDLLFPTFFRDVGEDIDNAYIKTLLVNGYNSKEVFCNIGDWIETTEPWVLVAPGVLNINGNMYISYMTRSWSHMSKMPDNGISKYKLIRIVVNKIDN